MSRLAAVALLGLLSLGACGGAPARAAGPHTVNITIHHSRFSPDNVRLQPGTTVRFVVRNTDPIEHELIVGDAAAQHLHEIGTDALHEGPGAVSVPAGATGVTAYTVPRTMAAEPLLYGCHLPGHWDYGMRGTITLSSSH